MSSCLQCVLVVQVGMGRPATAGGGGAGGSGGTVQEWEEMECRLQYMTAELEEAQAAGSVVVHRAADTAAAARLLRELSRPGDAVVLKGSRAARMERVLEEFA